MTPLNDPFYAGDKKDISLGWEYISQGALGTIILAGGMGTRLGFPHAKGLYPLSPVKEKSLFQLFAEKCFFASIRAGSDLPLAIMTSPENDAETRMFFKAHNFFNLKPEQVFFFVQGELHLEDKSGALLAEKAADGNGSVFKKFVESGLYDKWAARGIKYIHIILVDNALADPYDANLLGHHIHTNSDVTLKCTLRSSITEKVGLVVEIEDKIRVVEYSEIDPVEAATLDEAGQLRYPFANMSLFCLSMPFIKELATKDFPFHRAKKPLNKEPNAPQVYKKETFIFDMLPFASSPTVLAYPREDVFAPLKNKYGADSPATVKKLLSDKDCRTASKLTGVEVSKFPFELSAAYSYLPEEAKIKNLPLEEDYIS